MNAQLLLQKIPEINGWIQRTVAAHSTAARPLHEYAFRRLVNFYSAETLDSARVITVPRVPIPPLTAMGLPQFARFENGDFRGITYLNTYFLQDGAASDESLHFHELIHVVQWQHLGPERFLLGYALGYLLAGGYRANPFEEMAFRLQAQFDENPAPFKVEPAIRQQLDQLVPVLLAGISAH
jgi:hypothetical protein